MKQTHDMEKKIEKALESLDGIQRATPQPFFYTRLRARMARDNREWGGIAGLISRPVYALAMICAVLLINVWAVTRDTNEAVPTTPIQLASGDQQLTDEYNVAVTTFYDYETPTTR